VTSRCQWKPKEAHGLQERTVLSDRVPSRTVRVQAIIVGSRRPSLSPSRRGTPAHVRAPLLSTGPLDVVQFVQTWGKEMRRTNRSRRLPVVAFLCRSPACERWGYCRSRRGGAWNGTGRILSNGARDMGRALPTDFLRSEATWDDSQGTQGGGMKKDRPTF